jgi:hypothetical protein
MIKRLGFVSNSSSSSFTCYIPEKWNPSNEEILKASEDYFDTESDEEQNIEETIIKVRGAIDLIKAGESVSEYDNYAEFCTLDRLIPHEFIQSSQNVSSQGGEISGINIDKINKIVQEYS